MRRPMMKKIVRAFTLIEVIVAVGILTVVTVAIASVFDTVGKTVSAGSRLSTLNRLAFRIESIMGDDFEGLRRGTGFLVIRNEYAMRSWENGFDQDPASPAFDGVPLFPGDPEARLRRMDEIMFFDNSRTFRTRRAPLHPAMVATSSAARIYYGHGQQMPADVDGDGLVEPYRADNGGSFRPDTSEDWRFDRPRLDDLNDVAVSPDSSARLGHASLPGSFQNPNEFAQDWLLMRHVTLLTQPQLDRDVPNDIFGMDAIGSSAGSPSSPAIALARARIQDNSRQIALQPAAQSIFQPIAALQPVEIENLALVGALGGGSGPFPWGVRATATFTNTASDRFGFASGPSVDETLATPMFLSGLVDIATTDLPSIENEIRFGANTTAYAPWTPFNLVDFGGPMVWYDNPQFSAVSYQTQRANGRAVNSVRNLANPSATIRDEQEQQEWMLSALPSIAFDPLANAVSAAQYPLGFRMRGERRPPNLYPPVRVQGNPRALVDRYLPVGYPPNARVQELMTSIEQTDQEMLVNNVFLPRCSEFIVEWSYGVTDRRTDSPTEGSLIWHGLRRWDDLNGNGVYNAGDEPLVADLFVGDGAGFAQYDGVTIEGGTNADFRVPDELNGDLNGDGFIATAGAEQRIDPRIEALTLLRDRANPNQRPDPDDARVAEYVWGYADGDGSDWPWPTLVRITLRVTDDSESPTEQTYQVVFSVKSEGNAFAQ